MGVNESKNNAFESAFESAKMAILKRLWRPRSSMDVPVSSPPVTYQYQTSSSQSRNSNHIDSKSSKSSSHSNGSEPFNQPNFTWLENRRFLDTGYMLPSDDREKDRNVLQHFMLKKAFGKSIFPPVLDELKTGGRVLDIGCGSGTWALDVASDFPGAHIIGIDVIACFPESIYPSNCDFLVMDIFKTPMPLEDESFDVINMQLMGFVVTCSQWNDVLIELKRLLKPGGWIQWIEGDCQPWCSGPTCNDNTEKLRHIMTLRDLDPFLPRKFAPLLQRAGYDEINRQFVSLPLGDWGGPLGRVMASNCIEIMASIGPLYRTLYGWTTDMLDQRVDFMLKDMREYKGYFNYHLAIARKPISEF